MSATIEMDRLAYFAAVAELSSFSAAGRKLGVPTSTVSRAVAGLEAKLSLQLIQRTTRHVSLTSDGATLYSKIAPALQTISTALTSAPGRDEPSGHLRITAPADIGATFLAQAVTRFTARYPLVTVDVWLTSRNVDLVEEGFDAALRVATTPLKDSSLVARKLGIIELHAYASPSYLARQGTPRSSSDVANHAWVDFRGWKHPREYRSLILGARVVCDDFFFVREALRNGAGLGLLPFFLAQPDVNEGRLVNVLPEFCRPGGRLILLHPKTKHVSERLSAFRDVLVGAFAVNGAP